MKFEDIRSDEHFDRSKPTVVYIHGYLESSETFSVKTVVDAYLKRGGHNVIVIDWFEYSTGNYQFKVLYQLHHIGQVIARYLNLFIQGGYSSKRIHLVGHSMGEGTYATIRDSEYLETILNQEDNLLDWSPEQFLLYQEARTKSAELLASILRALDSNRYYLKPSRLCHTETRKNYKHLIEVWKIWMKFLYQ